LGFLALIGVSVEIGVIMVEYINQLRTRGMSPRAKPPRKAHPAVYGLS
jgi:Cu/Ag efflux pump CusA